VTQEQDPLPACVYCGVPIRAGRTCPGCRDLEQLDPLGTLARIVATEAELGVRNQHRVPKRAGRRELY
jgi:L-aminopeptidase/D-esterase-like protein